MNCSFEAGRAIPAAKNGLGAGGEALTFKRVNPSGTRHGRRPTTEYERSTNNRLYLIGRVWERPVRITQTDVLATMRSRQDEQRASEIAQTHDGGGPRSLLAMDPLSEESRAWTMREARRLTAGSEHHRPQSVDGLVALDRDLGRHSGRGCSRTEATVESAAGTGVPQR